MVHTKNIQTTKQFCWDNMGINVTDDIAEELYDKFPEDFLNNKFVIVNFLALKLSGLNIPDIDDTKETRLVFKNAMKAGALSHGCKLESAVWD